MPVTSWPWGALSVLLAGCGGVAQGGRASAEAGTAEDGSAQGGAGPASRDAGGSSAQELDGATAGPGDAGDSDAGWALVWSDEFDGPNLDTTVWNVANYASRVNGELEYYTSRTGADAGANVLLEGGALVLEAREESYRGRGYTSGRIDSNGTKVLQYGRFEARMQLPAETGLWPAFWLLGNNFSTVGWPNCGELDVMEEKGRLPSTIFSSLHHGPTQDIVETQSDSLAAGTFHDAWHVFALEWDAAGITWSVDGAPFFTVAKGAATGPTWPFDQPFFLVFDLAVGGTFDGDLAPPAGMPPQRLVVDYVRVYQRP